MKPFNVVKRFGAKVVAPLGAAVLGSAVMVSNAFAALDASVSTDVAASKSDVNDMGGLIIGVILAVAVIGWIRRVIR